MLLLTVANMNKGVGKTLATQRLAEALVSRGRRVLLLDLDPKMDHNLTNALGGERLVESPTHTLYAALKGKRTITPFAVGPALALIPAHSSLQQAETWRSLDLYQLGELDIIFLQGGIGGGNGRGTMVGVGGTPAGVPEVATLPLAPG